MQNEMITNVILLGLTVVIGIIGFFLRSIHQDHKKNISVVNLLKIDTIKNTFSIEMTQKQIDSFKELIEEKMGTINKNINRQTEAVEIMQKMVTHLDKNTSGLKMFFDKYEKIEDKQSDLEKRIAHLETLHENNGQNGNKN